MRLNTAVVLMLGLGLLVAACGGNGDDGPGVLTPTETSPPIATGVAGDTQTPPTAASTPTPGLGAATNAAIDALATWLGSAGDASAISVVSVEAMTWTNGCLEVGRAGQACTEALVEGYRIELALGDAVYEVRTDLGGDVVVWAPNVQILMRFQEAGTNSVTFTTDDGGTIEAQPVPGTGYGVELASLAEGDAVGVALADAPQGGGVLLVWVDPVFQ